jgi:hypothetical protein
MFVVAKTYIFLIKTYVIYELLLKFFQYNSLQHNKIYRLNICVSCGVRDKIKE